MTTMKEVIVYGEPLRAELVDSPIPIPADDEVLIKVEVSGSNPKDWKYPLYTKRPHNSGDDIAGTIVSVGKSVLEFKPGDRVAAFHKMGALHGSFAEYAIAYAYTTFHIPPSVTFEEASTVPLASLTAAYGLWEVLGLPTPWCPATEEIPFLVYGASTSVGTFAIKLAKLAGIGPIIGVAGSGAQVALEAGADFVVDYRNNNDIPGSIRAFLKPGQSLLYAWDTVSEHGSYQNAIQALEPGLKSKLCLILPERKFEDIDKTKTNYGIARVANSHDGSEARRDFAYIFYRQLTKWFQEGKFTGHRFDIVEGGLTGVEGALADLKAGRVSATKKVFRIKDTPGL
ncbi:chaperonin 10-like protein [Lipomyces orientalis]|uniref:Chaperonin 10-like protein n=1 Tax=Lipomyces orientalis TaxID=1233043 RepID=A0ACC3TUN4_9ASCO